MDAWIKVPVVILGQACQSVYQPLPCKMFLTTQHQNTKLQTRSSYFESRAIQGFDFTFIYHCVEIEHTIFLDCSPASPV